MHAPDVHEYHVIAARQALRDWDALDPLRDAVAAAKAAAERRGNYEIADELAADLHEQESEVGHALAEALRQVIA